MCPSDRLTGGVTDLPPLPTFFVCLYNLFIPDQHLIGSVVCGWQKYVILTSVALHL